MNESDSTTDPKHDNHATDVIDLRETRDVEVRRKVVIVSCYPPRGETHKGRGIGAYSKQLAVELAASGADVNVLANRVDGEPSVYEENGVRVHRSWRPGLRAVSDVLHAARMIRPDVVHFQHELFALGRGTAAAAPALAIRRLRTVAPVVTTVHGAIPKQNFPSVLTAAYAKWVPTPLVQRAYTAIMSSVLSGSDRLIAHDKTVASAIESYGTGTDVAVVPHGTAVSGSATVTRAAALQQLGWQDVPRVLFFGYLLPYKGLGLLEQIAPALRSQGIDVVVAGGQSGDDVPSHRVSVPTMSPHIRYLGHVEEADIPAIFAASDVLVLPYRVGMASSGPLSLAAVHRTPVVCSDVPTLADIVRTPEAVFPNGDADGLLRSVRTVLEREDVRNDVLLNLSRYARSSSWNTVASRTAELYDELLSQSRSGSVVDLRTGSTTATVR